MHIPHLAPSFPPSASWHVPYYVPDCVIFRHEASQPVGDGIGIGILGGMNVGQQNNPHAGRRCTNAPLPSLPLVCVCVLAGEKPAAMQHPAKSAADAQTTFNFHFASCQAGVVFLVLSFVPFWQHLLLSISCLNWPTTVSFVT